MEHLHSVIQSEQLFDEILKRLTLLNLRTRELESRLRVAHGFLSKKRG